MSMMTTSALASREGRQPHPRMGLENALARVGDESAEESQRRTMKRLAFAALLCLALSACATFSLPKNGTDFSVVVRTWVHPQMPADQAITVLESQGFKVGRYPPDNKYIRDRRDWIYGRASRWSGPCRSIVWLVRLAVEADKVAEIKTLVRETEPECVNL